MNIKLLNQKILNLAIQGKLVPQDPEDAPVFIALENIRNKKKLEFKKYIDNYIYQDSDKSYYKKFNNSITKINIPFVIPDTWSWCSIDSLFDIKNGFTPLRTNKDFWDNGTIPWFTISDIRKQGYIINDTQQKITSIATTQNRIVEPNSVLICCTASIGAVAINTISLTTNQQFNAISCKNEYKTIVDMKYIFYFANTLKKYLNNIAGSTTFGFVSVPKLGKILLPLPPLEEQKRIVSAIEDLLKQTESIQSNKEELKSIISTTKSKILNLAIQGKLVEQDPSDIPAQALLDDIKKEKEKLILERKLKKDKVDSIIYKEENHYYEKIGDKIKNIDDEIPFEIPENWSWCRLGTIFNIARGGSPRPIKNFLTDDINGLNWIKIGDTKQGEKYIFSTKEKIKLEGLSQTRFVNSGDFLLTNSMSFGRPYILKISGCIHDGWLVFGMIGKKINQDFLYFVLSSHMIYTTFYNIAAGSTVKNLKSDSVKNVLIPLPPLEEQKRIVHKIDEIFSQLSSIDTTLASL